MRSDIDKVIDGLRDRSIKPADFLADDAASRAWAMAMATKLRDADPRELVGLDCRGLNDLRMLGEWILNIGGNR